MSDVDRKDGQASWVQLAGDLYVVTGTDVNGKRFRISTGNWRYADGINVFRGSIWLLRKGKRSLIRRVFCLDCGEPLAPASIRTSQR